jgi:hypothetical protein
VYEDKYNLHNPVFTFLLFGTQGDGLLAHFKQKPDNEEVIPQHALCPEHL